MWFKQAEGDEMERLSKRQAAVLSVLSGDVKVEADIVSEGDLDISGSVEGDVVARKLTLGVSGAITGSIKADVAVIAGRIVGRLTARTVTLVSTAHVAADVTHVVLEIQQEAVFEGFSHRVETIDAAADEKPCLARLNGPASAEAQSAA